MLGTLVVLSELGPDWYGKDYTAAVVRMNFEISEWCLICTAKTARACPWEVS